jgi:hypothetical protein
MRDTTTPVEILESIVGRLRDQVEVLNEATCFVSDQPTPLKLPSGRIACTVAASNGAFPDDMWTGSGILTVSRAIVVTPMVQMRLDRPNRGEAKILSDAGILQLETAVLKSLLADSWEPELDGRPLLRDGTLIPRSIQGPASIHVGEAEMIATQITFMATFDWDLS